MNPPSLTAIGRRRTYLRTSSLLDKLNNLRIFEARFGPRRRGTVASVRPGMSCAPETLIFYVVWDDIIKWPIISIKSNLSWQSPSWARTSWRRQYNRARTCACAHRRDADGNTNVLWTATAGRADWSTLLVSWESLAYRCRQWCEKRSPRKIVTGCWKIVASLANFEHLTV